MRIAVYAISKNEEQFAEKFCKSAVDADVIVVGDTGSTDDTKGLLRDNGAIVARLARGNRAGLEGWRDNTPMVQVRLEQWRSVYVRQDPRTTRVYMAPPVPRVPKEGSTINRDSRQDESAYYKPPPRSDKVEGTVPGPATDVG